MLRNTILFSLALAGLFPCSVARAADASDEKTATYPAHYLVVSAGERLAPQATYYRRVQMTGPMVGLDDGRAERLAADLHDRQGLGARVRLLDRDGRAVYQTVVRIPLWQRSETPPPDDGLRVAGERGVPVDAYHERLDEASFAVRVPVIEGASDLEISYTAGDSVTSSTLDLDDLARRSFRDGDATASLVAGESVEPVPGFQSGPSNNRLDVLFIAEGYLDNPASRFWFRGDTSKLANGFLSGALLDGYRSHFNLWRLFVPSAEEGADRPRCPGDPDANGNDTGDMVNTAFDATYCGGGQWRNLRVDQQDVLTAASGYPDWDMVIAVVNSPYRGGSGGQVPVTSLDTNYAVTPDIVGVLKHEFAHGFGGLGDEYERANPSASPCSDVMPGVDACEPNVTDVTNRNNVKWRRWISPSTPVPTSSPLSDPRAAGLWEGARFMSSGMYRQCFNGIMRNTLRPFCKVDRELMLISLYSGGWGVPAGGISTIVPGSRSPSSAFLTVYSGQVVNLQARTFAPPNGPDVTVEWWVNGVRALTESVSPGSTTSFPVQAEPSGTVWTVTMKVFDNSPFLHPQTRSQLVRQETWSIQVVGPGQPL